ncbi:uncharacterized protein N7458_010845 [Penicillium daleae]|uniref:Uncharacterized protein n=1 Tax=Penicillium daleae TaxID=63821 RepID=A0AAD6C017_9EURO|nr:uncharacterized protein N7458_010845 [Penicillium daleae]KAJ5439847.1 hypothetical protein N7458_010845 [Penicillium daleae]
MAWYSILPPQLIQFESWAVRIFFLLGLITIVPWAALIVFDVGLYLYRMILWELPWIGGRARGQQRPRPPSLQERPGGQRRAFGLRSVETDAGDSDFGKSGNAPSSKSTRREQDSERENMDPAADGDVKRRVTGRA